MGSLFSVLRQLERWLHQHMFKMGWLLTKNFKTTTVLYYAFFLPGVVLHEVSLWFAASMLNVRADRSIRWPDPQEVAQLRLEFVRPAKNAGRFKTALMNLFPLIVGIGAIWIAANTILNVPAALAQVSTGQLTDVTAGINRLTSAPDFWLWVYVLFTIANTMMPDFKTMRGWWPILIAVGVLSVVLFLIGLGDETVLRALTGPVATALNLVAGTFAITIAIDLVVVAVLGTLEAIIERFTGDSATFKNGKLIAITRKERLQQEAQQRTSARAARKKAAAAIVPTGPPSIYNLPLPIPEAPGKESAALPAQPARPELAPGKPQDDRVGPALISGSISDKPSAPPVLAPPGVTRSPSPVASQPKINTPLPGPARAASPAPNPALTSPAAASPPVPRPAAPLSSAPDKPDFSALDDDEEMEASLMDDDDDENLEEDLDDEEV